MTAAAPEPAASAAPEDTAPPARASKRSPAATSRRSAAADVADATTGSAPSPAAGTASAATTAPPAAASSQAAGSSDVKGETADITAGPGGVMTDDVGVITGDLTLRTELSGDKVTLRIQYKDAEEWYVVTGGRATLTDPADLPAVHQIAVALLNRPEG